MTTSIRYNQKDDPESTYLTDDIMDLIRLEDNALQHAGFAGLDSFVQNWSVTSKGISQVTGMPSLFQDVLKIISFLKHGIYVLEKYREIQRIHKIYDYIYDTT